jgi:hypothetical protein
MVIYAGQGKGMILYICHHVQTTPPKFHPLIARKTQTALPPPARFAAPPRAWPRHRQAAHFMCCRPSLSQPVPHLQAPPHPLHTPSSPATGLVLHANLRFQAVPGDGARTSPRHGSSGSARPRAPPTPAGPYPALPRVLTAPRRVPQAAATASGDGGSGDGARGGASPDAGAAKRRCSKRRPAGAHAGTRRAAPAPNPPPRRGDAGGGCGAPPRAPAAPRRPAASRGRFRWRAWDERRVCREEDRGVCVCVSGGGRSAPTHCVRPGTGREPGSGAQAPGGGGEGPTGAGGVTAPATAQALPGSIPLNQPGMKGEEEELL